MKTALFIILIQFIIELTLGGFILYKNFEQEKNTNIPVNEGFPNVLEEMPDIFQNETVSYSIKNKNINTLIEESEPELPN